VASVRPLTLRFSARARTQLISILEYIEGERGHAAAVRIAENIREAAELLCYFPYAGRLGRVAGTREWVVRRLHPT
jgi:plasmid stabilization system protein ParE